MAVSQFQFPLKKKKKKETTAEKVSAILAPHFAICPIIFWAKNFEESTPEHSSWGLLCKRLIQMDVINHCNYLIFLRRMSVFPKRQHSWIQQYFILGISSLPLLPWPWSFLHINIAYLVPVELTLESHKVISSPLWCWIRIMPVRTYWLSKNDSKSVCLTLLIFPNLCQPVTFRFKAFSLPWYLNTSG